MELLKVPEPEEAAVGSPSSQVDDARGIRHDALFGRPWG